MLTITRKDRERVILYVGDSRISIKIRKDASNRTALDIQAGPEVKILREELEADWLKARKESTNG